MGALGSLRESAGVGLEGVVYEQLMEVPDHRDSIGSVHDLLFAHGVPGIQEIDTRELTRRVREHGTVLYFGPAEAEREMLVRLDEMTPPDAEDLVAEVTCDEAVIINPGAVDNEGKPLPRLAAIDCGVKHNILRELAQRFEVVWCPATTTFDEILKWEPDSFFASNGPGDRLIQEQLQPLRIV